MTPKQEAALREYLQEAIVPLIEQVLVKKLGQAMSFAAEQLIQPKPASKPWVGLTDEEMREVYKRTDWDMAGGWEYERAIEAKLREKNAQPSKPLTDEQRMEMWRTTKFRGNGGQVDWFIEGTRAAEAAHGIKGDA